MTDRPKMIRFDPREHSTFTELPDGTWEAAYAVLDLTANGPTADAAWDALQTVLTAKITDDEAARAKHFEYGVEHRVVVEMPEGEWRAQQEMVAAGKEAASGFTVLTDETFDGFITGDVPALVDFWAEWCKPCHMLAPTL